MRLAATTTEYVHVPVTVPEGVDLSGVTPKVAFQPVHHRTNPEPDDYHTGAWDNGDARILVGPDGGATTLEPGDYWPWVTFDPPGSENITMRSTGVVTVE